MSFTSEGTIEIDLANFWEWVHKEHLPVSRGTEIRFGVPRVNKGNMTLDIDFAASTDCNPADWAVKPKAVTQWQEPECSPTDDADQKIIELRVTQTFYDAVKLLAGTEGISSADVIRKAVCHYAKAQVERRLEN
jgi:hypothetical protein